MGENQTRSGRRASKRFLSKSKLLSFIQCPRRLYLEIHRPDLLETSETAERVMAAGTHVGEVARSFYPEGVLVDSNEGLGGALRLTEEYLESRPRRPLFEATLQHDRVLVRADLLLPRQRSWHLVEVKSSTSVKDYHLNDAAIQRHVVHNAGAHVSRVSVRTLNNQFVYPGNGVYYQVGKGGHINSLFSDTDVTRETKELADKAVPEWIETARKTLSRRQMPAMTDNCDDPFECPFKGFCHGEGPDYPVESLPRIGQRAQDLKDQGYLDIRDIPQGVLSNERHERVRRVTVSGEPELNPDVREVLKQCGYPRYYIDFETINFPVPIWKGTRPYQQVPFQWSCHIEKRSGQIDHLEFLDLSGNDPSRAFAETLIKAVRKRGPVFVYNQGFEGWILRELAQRFKDLEPALTDIAERFVDLLPLTRDHYYHPDMVGSWSIKAVLPTIAPDLDYGSLEEVQDGGQAQVAFGEAIADETTQDRREQLRDGLLAYCERDTEAMVRLAHFLGSSKTTSPGKDEKLHAGR